MTMTGHSTVLLAVVSHQQNPVVLLVVVCVLHQESVHMTTPGVDARETASKQEKMARHDVKPSQRN